jgi:hypothetical protein
MYLKDLQVREATRIPRAIEDLDSNGSEVYVSELIKSLKRSKNAYSEKLLKFEHRYKMRSLRTQVALFIV